MVKKVYLLTAISVFVMQSASCIDFRTGPPEPPPFKMTSMSPQGKYAINLERRRHEPYGKDWETWKAFLSFTNDGQQILKEVEVASGDASSGRMLPDHPQLAWLYENTFRLSEHASLPESESDVLLIRNDSAHTISYLSVSGGMDEWFFILNLQPRSSVKLLALPQWKQGDLSWVSAKGRFGDDIPTYGGQNFKIAASEKGPGHYCLTVRDDEMVIQSREFEGWELKEPTAEEQKTLLEIAEKKEKGIATKTDEETERKIWNEREEIIIPRDPSCGGSGKVSKKSKSLQPLAN